MEAPLPPDWDKEKFNKGVTSFKDMVAYARERAQRIGSGSSRIAFLVPYQGRTTVLKIAKNRKGLAQNEEESVLFDDDYIRSLGITIPMIDYDERNPQPTWVHVEAAQRISEGKLASFFEGVEISDVVVYITNKFQSHQYPHRIDEATAEILKNNDNFSHLFDLLGNYQGVIEPWDLTRAANWGLYRGNPVIIDLGYTSTTAELYKR